MEKELRNILMIFDIESQISALLLPTHYTNYENSIIFFEYVDSYAKIFLILYPTLQTSTTCITIRGGESVSWHNYLHL